VGTDNHLWFNQSDLTDLLGEELAHLLYHLPDGSMIDVAFALAGKPALTQRYRGPVADGRWQVLQTYPGLTREALAGGLDLARYASTEPEKHALHDEAEAQAVVDLSRRDPNLWDLKVQRAGRTVWSESDIVGHLTKAIFRHRYAGHWDVAAHDREAEQKYRAYLDQQRQWRRAGAQAARRRAAPHDAEVLFRGRLGLYWRSDFARLDQLEQETREQIDTKLAGLGFQHVGDMVAKKQRDIVVRTYVSGDRLSYAVLLAKRTMYLGLEFFSRFQDGSMLTTTTNGAVESRPQLKVYFKVHASQEPAELSDKHQWGIERFRTRQGTQPVALDPTLLGVAREYDQALARRECDSLKIRIVSLPPGEPPAPIRAAWIGCVLPLFATTDDPRVGQQVKGVLSGEQKDRPQGLAVRALDALRALESRDAAAAQWWREHAPQVLEPGKLFIFPAEACELVEDLPGAVA
jgi:hypothetical protein